MLYILLLLAPLPVVAQSQAWMDSVAALPRSQKSFDIDYKINLPRPDPRYWDQDFGLYYKYLSPALNKTQMTMSHTDQGVEVMLNPNSILPHAQLDTLTAISEPGKLQGIWRMQISRNLRFTDSMSYAERKIYRADTVLANSIGDAAFAVFEDNNFKLWAREKGKSKFKKEIASRFLLEQNRFLMLYKYFKSGSGVSQIGIDEQGNLILNYPSVIENKKPGVYVAYIAVIQQFIFEKVQ